MLESLHRYDEPIHYLSRFTALHTKRLVASIIKENVNPHGRISPERHKLHCSSYAPIHFFSKLSHFLMWQP